MQKGRTDYIPVTNKLASSQNATEKSAIPSTRKVLNVTLLAGEWNSSNGGLSTINRELAIHLSNIPSVKVSFLVPEGTCKYEEKFEAHRYGITVVEAKERAAYDHLDWLGVPPKGHIIDIVVGHGVKLGRQVQFIRETSRFPNCKWIQVVHTAPEELSKYKRYHDPIPKGERKHQSEVELCKMADLVVPVGPKLNNAYSSYLQRCKTDQDVLSITPGLFDREFGDLRQFPNHNAEFKVLLFGRGDEEDFDLKGYNIAAQAFTDERLKNKPYHLIFVGAPKGKEGEVRKKFLDLGIATAQLTVRRFVKRREKLKDFLCEAHLAIMPSKSEGFGLVALEALSAGLPILVGKRTGFAEALKNVRFGHVCIVNHDDPVKWAESIEAVRARHEMCLEETKAVRSLFGEKYSWTKQCEALVERMLKMVDGCKESENIPKASLPVKEHLPSEELLGSRSEERANIASGDQSEASLNKESGTQNMRKCRIAGLSMEGGHNLNFHVKGRLVAEKLLGSSCEKNADSASGNQPEVSTIVGKSRAISPLSESDRKAADSFRTVTSPEMSKTFMEGTFHCVDPLVYYVNSLSDFDSDVVMAFKSKSNQKIKRLASTGTMGLDLFICVNKIEHGFVLCVPTSGYETGMVDVISSFVKSPFDIPARTRCWQYELCEGYGGQSYKISRECSQFRDVEGRIHRRFYIGSYEGTSLNALQFVAMEVAPHQYGVLLADCFQFAKKFCIQALEYSSNRSEIEELVLSNITKASSDGFGVKKLTQTISSPDVMGNASSGHETKEQENSNIAKATADGFGVEKASLNISSLVGVENASNGLETEEQGNSNIAKATADGFRVEKFSQYIRSSGWLENIFLGGVDFSSWLSIRYGVAMAVSFDLIWLGFPAIIAVVIIMITIFM